MKACPQCHLRYPQGAVYCFLDGAELRVIVDPLIGSTIAGRYVVDEIIGQGGMATVYRARNKLGDAPCAIKVMNAALARDPIVRERFRREAKNVQTIAHPNVVEIFEHGETDEATPYMVMELLDGRTLAELLLEGPIAPARAIPLMIQLARGIARAHDLGLVHRDLKPENVFVCRRVDGTDLVKVLDFGIARSQSDPRLTSAGELFGTPQYMAPERVSSGEAGPSVDLYALGVIFYETATGKLPFEADDPTTLLVKHLKDEPPRPRAIDPRVPAELEALIMQLLEKEPSARPVDARRVEKDLLWMAAGLGALVPPDPENDPASSYPISKVYPDAGPSSDWARRVEVFGQMLSSHMGGAPAALARALAEMNAGVAELDVARHSSAIEQQRLDEIDARGREGRQRFGFAVDALGLDTSRARDDLRAARIDFERVVHQTMLGKEAYAAALAEVVMWEGRSGFEEPHAHLANAYRSCAAAVDGWVATRRLETQARAVLEEKEQSAADLDYQLGALRTALAVHEESIAHQRETSHGHLVDLDARVERMEALLVALATRFCEPLRSRPELGSLFRRLESARPPQGRHPGGPTPG